MTLNLIDLIHVTVARTAFEAQIPIFSFGKRNHRINGNAHLSTVSILWSV